MATNAQQPTPAPDHDAWKLFVFRKNRDLLPARELVTALQKEIEGVLSGAGPALDALVRAGELETALTDAESHDERLLARVTDRLAAYVAGEPACLREALRDLEQLDSNIPLRCAHPEGFSYYGLNPLDFADLTRRLIPQLPREAAVIGIRSVGSTLGAVVIAVLRAARLNADRTTVRPQGEPYQRSASFTAPQLAWIAEKLERGADFLVVDEGPGFSGSTFLCVAKALELAGVPSARIVLLCSQPFTGRHGPAAEWGRFRSYVSHYGRRVPAEANRNMGGGYWREMLYGNESQWPACWTDLETVKHLSVDGSALFKFEGFGRFGDNTRRRAQALADAGFSPRPLDKENGYSRYGFLCGRPLTRQDLSAELLNRMAEYCAFRARYFTSPHANPALLVNMMQVNLNEELAMENPVSQVEIMQATEPDCRMMPHEWILTQDDRLVKTDGVAHAEGHQLPGPADIAWDLAGIIAEWNLSSAEGEFLLRQYQRLSSDDAAPRILKYLLVYLVHRMSHCRMGAAAMQCWRDGPALFREYRMYAQKVKVLLRNIRLVNAMNRKCVPALLDLILKFTGT